MSSVLHKEDFSKVPAKRGMILQERQPRQFEEYVSMLIERDQKINLTVITGSNEIYEKHFLDSILPSFSMLMQGSFYDVGAGAGLPGIPLKIIYPELELTVAETLEKRVTFLSALCSKLQLKGVTCVHERTGVYVGDHRESFDVVNARAVTNLPLLSELCIPLVKKQGNFLALKDANGDKEYTLVEKAVRLLGCEVEQRDVHTSSDGSQWINFAFVKTRSTSKKYPRPLAQMRKNPL